MLSPRMTKSEKRDRSRFFLYISPWVVGFVLFSLIPMGMSLYYSFTDWDVLTPETFVGFQNYIDLLSDDLFIQSIKVTATYTAFAVPINVLLALLLAMLLNFDGPLAGVFRTIFYLPAVLSSVVTALLFQWIFNSKYGLLNNFLAMLGIEGPRWLADPHWAMASLVILAIWSLGGGLIMFLAGLQAVPQDLYEAARIDGAGFWSRLVNITLPSMSPIILFMLMTSLIGALQTFTQAYIITSGGPANATLFYVLYLYNNAFVYHKMGKACAMAWLLLLICVGLSALLVRVTRSRVYYESDAGGGL